MSEVASAEIHHQQHNFQTDSEHRQHDRVAIIDFGSQYTQLIARRIRELGVYSEIFQASTEPAVLLNFAPKCVILSGGPESVSSPMAPNLDLQSLRVPVLGICYGMQLMAQQLGGAIENLTQREFGQARIRLQLSSLLFDGVASDQTDVSVWMSHGDRVVELPPGFTTIASSSSSSIAAIADEKRAYYGLQFHPEVTHTPCGQVILKNFVCRIANCKQDWQPSFIIEDNIKNIRATVGDGQVLLALSGGVDSSVAAVLLHRAIADNLHCVFVDNGLLRSGERNQVTEVFADYFGIDLHVVDGSERFLNALSGIHDPEKKRQIIGKLFIEIFEEYAQTLGRIDWLAQGTIYPDIIESAGVEGAHLIKSHHNVGGLPGKMRLKVIEPLANLFKDEVRALGKELGLDARILERHPFPGPGLAVRILGPVDQQSLTLLRQADKIFLEELHRHGLYTQIAQAFAVILPVKSVGVMGDGRQYGRVLVLRAVESDDFMTAASACLPPDFISHVASRIVNEVQDITRVCYDLSSKPPATIEWE